MFTGLILQTGRILSVQLESSTQDFAASNNGKNIVKSAQQVGIGSHDTIEGCEISIETSLANQLSTGDSIAVDGVCLTATAVTKNSFTAQMMSETLNRTTLGELEVDSKVNLELPPRATDRLGGHLVQGHVDGIATVTAIAQEGIARRLNFNGPNQLAPYIVPQGSIAINGVSLTVVESDFGGFSVSLIPETIARTNLADLVVGQAVNIEVDAIAKYVERLLAHRERIESNSH